MTHTAKELFPDWYFSADLTLSNDAIKSRISVIEDIVNKKQKLTFWNDLIKIYLGTKVTDDTNRTLFVNAFKADDVSFPLSNNENIIRVLAAITLCFKLDPNLVEEEDGAEDIETDAEETDEPEEIESDDIEYYALKEIISLGLLNSNFFEQYIVPSGIPVFEFAKYTFDQIAINEGDKLDEKIEKLTKIEKEFEEDVNLDLSSDDMLTIIQSIKEVIESNKRLNEETNVMWWVFGEYSKTLKEYYSKIKTSQAILVAANELANITTLHSISPAKHFLKKIISITNYENKGKKGTTILDVSNSLGEILKEKILKNIGGTLNEFTPCLLTIEKSMNYSEGEDWTTAYKKVSKGIDIKKQFTPEQLATQFYKEIIYISLI